MNPVELIRKKRDGEAHSRAEIDWIIGEITAGRMENYQAAAWMMAVWFKGMSDAETAWLTEAMIHSGDTVDLSSLQGKTVDKHSTGGVGDTTTLILAPLVASAGALVAKMSGRGLGHTGGTLDKMEAAGLHVDLDGEEFLQQVREIGVAVISQTKKLVPADGILYSLRDVTATIDSIPLIASSIMSKKVACGADCILLDVKFGDGAFMTRLEDARELAEKMVAIGRQLGRQVRAALSSMEQPLGTHIGNVLEFKEAAAILRGENRDSDLAKVALTLASHLLVMAEICPDLAAAESRCRDLLDSGQALDRLRQLVQAQRGDPRIVEQPELLPSAPIQTAVAAPKTGYLTRFAARRLGETAMTLGAGRIKKGDPIDPAVGLVLAKRLGQPVEAGEPLAWLHARNQDSAERARQQLLEAVEISEQTLEPSALIEDIVC